MTMKAGERTKIAREVLGAGVSVTYAAGAYTAVCEGCSGPTWAYRAERLGPVQDAWDDHDCHPVAGRSLSSTEEAAMSGDCHVRPRRGDLEAATAPHPFQPSGEYVGYGQTKERCDLCGLVQQGKGTHHDVQVSDA